MNIEQLREYCLNKPNVSEGTPFGEDTLVFKVHDKMFALTNMEGPLTINLKCDPMKALVLRDRYECVEPGYHMNKKHWNTIRIDNTLPDSLIEQWVDDSYNLIVNSLPKSKH